MKQIRSSHTVIVKHSSSKRVNISPQATKSTYISLPQTTEHYSEHLQYKPMDEAFFGCGAG